MDRLLKARVGAARMVLKSIADPEARTITSRVQAAAICELASSEPGIGSLSSESRANLVCLASDAPWAPGDLVLVLKALSPPVPSGGGGAPSAKKQRSTTQVWAPAILGYFPANFWDDLNDCGNWINAQDLLISFVLSLGGRCLSEPTSKCLTSLSLLFTDSNAKLLPIATKEAAFHKFKRELKKRTRPMAKPSTWIEQLPPSPMELKRTDPELFDLVYAQNPPVAAKINLGQLMVVDSSFHCRGGAGLRALVPVDSAQGDGAMALMSQMIALQQQNMQLVMGSSGPRGGLSSLRALTSGPSTFQRCMTMPESEESLAMSLQSSASAPDALASVPDAMASAPWSSASDALVSLQPPKASAPDDLPQEEPPRRAPLADVERPSLANKMLGDFLNMEAGMRAAKKQKTTHHAEVAIVSAPLQSQEASLVALGDSASSPGASASDAHLASASDARASAPDAHLASAPEATLEATPTKLAQTSAPPASETKVTKARCRKAPPAPQKTSPATSGKVRNPFRLDHMKTRNVFVVRMGGGIGGSKSFSYTPGDESSQRTAHAEATKLLEEAKSNAT